MTPTIRRARAIAIVIFGFFLIGLIGTATAGARPTDRSLQETSGCGAFVDGRSTSEHSSPQDALELDVDSVHRVQATAPADANTVRVEVETPIGSVQALESAVQPGSQYDNPNFRIDEKVAPYGVGLYRVQITAGSCEETVWVRIVGRSPLTTVTGIAGMAAAALGLSLLAWGIVRAIKSRDGKGRRGIVRGAIGGALGGMGALLLSQQFGWIGITRSELITWVVLPALGGAMVTGITSALVSSGGATAAPVPPPAPAPPPPPTPTTPPPPPPPTPPAPPTVEAGRPPVEAGPPPAEVGAGAGPPGSRESSADPPRSSYARMEAPEAVVAEDEFVLIVGLAAEPIDGVLNPEIVRPETSVGPYTLVVQVVADGFSLVEGEWRRELPVTAPEPYPSTTYRLRADALSTAAGATDVWSRPIQALYSIDGQTVGVAIRTMAVVARAELLQSAPAPAAPSATVIAITPQEDAPDLTARITYSASVSDGRLLWTFETTHGIPIPAEEIVTDVGSRPQVFARDLIAGVASHRGDPGLVEFLTGIGRTVSDEMPQQFFDLLAAVAQKVDRPPRVLLLSQEPYVPWELAALEPALDGSAPPFLAAQADVGRWVFGARRPPLPPPLAVDAREIAVVSGVYPDTAWRLVDAEEEAATLVEQWHATSVDAAAATIVDCLKGRPPADVLHFAVHGTYAPEGILEGLILVDGERLDPMVVKGCALERAPFVFLNACQVGSSNEVLGDYSGMAEAFLHAGAAAVVAPLWSIDDVAAKELALRFYGRVFRDGATPAAVLRDERAAFAGPDGDGAATRLAYQYFGHPALVLRGR